MTGLQRMLLAIAAAAAIAPSGCGDDSEETSATTSPGAGPGLTEAAPEAPPAEPAGGEQLPPTDEAAVNTAIERYVTALNGGRGDLVCALIAPGAVELSELPRKGGDCGDAVTASVGHRRPGGTPAWKRTTIREVTAVSVGDGEARVTATVTHDFADRRYVSVEEDVIYLRKEGAKWLIAKPSGTFYRAVGYPEPPLRALAPP